MVDRLARYAAPRWYLNQFNCKFKLGLCSAEADHLVSQAIVALDPEVEQQLLAEAHRELMAREAFIPLGAPIRWSLVRGTIAGFEANPWGLHPLFPLSQPPN
jgi:ABC-type transport system substrate-binding protein